MKGSNNYVTIGCLLAVVVAGLLLVDTGISWLEIKKADLLGVAKLTTTSEGDLHLTGGDLSVAGLHTYITEPDSLRHWNLEGLRTVNDRIPFQSRCRIEPGRAKLTPADTISGEQIVFITFLHKPEAGECPDGTRVRLRIN